MVPLALAGTERRESEHEGSTNKRSGQDLSGSLEHFTAASMPGRLHLFNWLTEPPIQLSSNNRQRRFFSHPISKGALGRDALVASFCFF